MAGKTKIEWTDATWNPIRGCAIVSAGCANCYAMRQAHRQSGEGGAYEGLTRQTKHGPIWTGKVKLVPDLLDLPLRWKKPRRIFVNSMSDLFHEKVPDEFIDQVFAVMAQCSEPWYRCRAQNCDHDSCPENSLEHHDTHTFQLLTKRPSRMQQYMITPNRFEKIIEAWKGLGWYFEFRLYDDWRWPLHNVHLGVSVEDQPTADERIPLLLQTPAAVRWISAEPLLGGICLSDTYLDKARYSEAGTLDWLVVGGESGPGARPMHPDWAQSLRDQCVAAGVPFFFKQWGEWVPDGQAAFSSYSDRIVDADTAGKFIFYRVGKRASGRLLDGRTWDEYPGSSANG